MRMPVVTSLLFASVVAAPQIYQGCPGGDDTPTPTPTPVPSGCAEDTIEVDGVCLPDLPEGWTQIFPGGNTICARGGEFSYFVKPGKVNKLVIGFDGGGACWDALTCSVANPTFTDSVTEDDNPNNMTDGVFEFDNPENPFKDWYAVFIPYCTGDIHWGDSDVVYPPSNGAPPVHILHNGYKNGDTVMNWIYSHFGGPERIFITGVSAGSYGTMMFSPYVMDHYPSADVVQLGDSGAGVITQEWLETSFNSWNAQANFPEWIPEIQQADITTLTMNDVYIQEARYFPDQLFSQYNTSSDDVQEFYYEAMGADPATWSAGMDANINACAAGATNFRYYTAWGSQHGVLPYNEFYTYQVNGVRFLDWATALVSGSVPDSVHCVDCVTEEYYQP